MHVNAHTRTRSHECKHTWPLRLTTGTHTHNEGASQLATQPVTRMLFSTTGGSTLPSQPTPTSPLPSATCITPSPIFFSSLSIYLCICLPFSNRACCVQVQVAGCNLSNVSPSPLCTQVCPSPPPCLHSPLHIWPAQGPCALCFFS